MKTLLGKTGQIIFLVNVFSFSNSRPMCFLKHSIKSIKAAKAVIQTLFSCLQHTASAEGHCRLTATATERGIWSMRPQTTGLSIDSNAFQFMTPFTETNFPKIGWEYSFSRSDIYFSPLPIHWSNLSVEITTTHHRIAQHFLPPSSFSNLFLHTPELKKVSSWTLHTPFALQSQAGLECRAQVENGQMRAALQWWQCCCMGHLGTCPLWCHQRPTATAHAASWGFGWSSGGTHIEPESLWPSEEGTATWGDYTAFMVLGRGKIRRANAWLEVNLASALKRQ